MVVKRTFAEKQAIARATVKAREVSRIEKGYLTSREKSVEFREGAGTSLERAKAELETAQRTAARVLPTEPISPFDPRREAIRYTTLLPPREAIPEVFRKPPEEYYREAFRPIPSLPTEEPLRVTRAIPPPMPTAEVFMGTRPYGAAVIPVFEKRPISEVPLAVAPRGFEFPPLEYGIRPIEKITPIKKAKVKVIRAITPPAYEFIAGAVSVPVALAKLPVEIYKKPKETLARLFSPAAWIESGRRIYRGVMAAEPRAVGEVAGMIALYKLPKVGKIIGRRVSPIITRISPKFRGIVGVGRRRVIPRIPTAKGIKEIGIARPIKDIGISIEKQIALAGKRITAVTAARDLFGRIIKRRVVIKKPKVPKAPPLERALFADPFARLRIGRLELKEPRPATLAELVTGRAVLRRPRPQAIIFPDQIVAKFPKALKKVKAKLKAGKPLTVAEKAKLLKFQLEPTGEFKPLGFVTREPEITLAPSEIIRRKKVVGVTLIRGRRVSIIEAEVIKPTKAAAKLLKKRRAGTITTKELALLKTKLRRETGFDVSRALERRPYYDPLRVPKLLGISPVITKPPRVRRVPPIPAIRPRVAVKPPYKPVPALGLISPIIPRPKVVPRISPMAQILGISAMAVPAMPEPPRLRRPFRLIEKETKAQKKRRKRAEAIARKQQLKYQASVGAVTLGITAPRIPRVRLTGLELRPVIKKKKGKKRKKKKSYSNNYINNLNKILK